MSGRPGARKRGEARHRDELCRQRLREPAGGRDADAQTRERAGPASDRDAIELARGDAGAVEQLGGHPEQPGRVSGVRASGRVVAGFAHAPVGQAQRDGGRAGRRVDSEHDHRGVSAAARERPLDLHEPQITAAVRQGNREPRGVELGLGVRRPLDERDPSRPEVVGEHLRLLVREPGETVEVEMGNRHAGAAVAVADREGRARDGVHDAERRAAPRTSVVLPAPSSPRTSTTSPSARVAASSAPSASVSAGPLVRRLRLAIPRL